MSEYDQVLHEDETTVWVWIFFYLRYVLNSGHLYEKIIVTQVEYVEYYIVQWNLLLIYDLCAYHSETLITEPHAGEFKAFWFNLQQQMVHGHQYYSVSQQEGSLWGENTQVPAHHMLSRIYR